MTSTTSAQPAPDGSARWHRYLSGEGFLQGSPSANPAAAAVVKVSIPRSVRARVASPQALQQDGYQLDLAPENAGDEAIDQVGSLLEPHPAGMRALGADFHWGVARCLFALEPLQADLVALGAEESDSARVSAYTLIDTARSAFAAAQYAEAAAILQDVFKLEGEASFGAWRAHFIDGLLRFGFVGGDMSLIDLDVAERRFATAARLVKTQRPQIGAQALTVAAHAAILGERLGRAHGYLEAATTLDDELAEAHFLASRVFLRQGNSRGAYEATMRALALDQGYAVRAGSVDATLSDVSQIGSMLVALSRDLRRRGNASMLEALQRLRLLANHAPAHKDTDVLTLRAFVHDEDDWPVYDVIRILAQKNQLIDEIFDRYREVRVISNEQQAGAQVTIEEVRRVAAPKRAKATTAAHRLFGRDGADDQPETREQRRKVMVELGILSSTIRDISGRILTEFDLVQVPPGTFVMGSLADEEGRNGDELPHEVNLTRPFFIGVMPVTQELWHAVMDNNPSYYDGHDRPVEQISWVDALVFCNELSHMNGLPPCYEIGRETVKWLGPEIGGYRLPTEAEWERACRAGTSTPTASGPKLDPSQGNLARRHGQLTTPVGTYAPSQWGLLDMHGNIWEWCFDAYGDYANAQGDDPCVVSQHDLRCARGGSWDSEPRECRAASRAHYSRWSRRNTVGFRLAMSTSAKAPTAVSE